MRPCPECGCYTEHHVLCPAGDDLESRLAALEMRQERRRKSIEGNELKEVDFSLDDDEPSE